MIEICEFIEGNFTNEIVTVTPFRDEDINPWASLMNTGAFSATLTVLRPGGIKGTARFTSAVLLKAKPIRFPDEKGRIVRVTGLPMYLGYDTVTGDNEKYFVKIDTAWFV